MNLSREVLAALKRHHVLSIIELAAELNQPEDKIRNAIGTLKTYGKVRGERLEPNMKHYSITELGSDALARPLRRHRKSRAKKPMINSVFQWGERA